MLDSILDPRGAPPGTLLEAVNILLASIGESPVLSLEGDEPLPADAEQAVRALKTASTSCQMYGFLWNTVDAAVLTPDTQGIISLGDDVLKVVAGAQYTTRGQSLFDRANNTSIFTKPVTAKVTYALAFSDCPAAARQYITAKAAQAFQAGAFGSPQLAGQLDKEASLAWQDLMGHESETSDHNVFTDSRAGQDIFAVGH